MPLSHVPNVAIIILLCASAHCLTIPAIAEDPAEALSTARMRYEEKVNAACDLVLKDLNRLEQQAQAAKPQQKDQIKQISAYREAFVESGEWPKTSVADAQRKIVEGARDTLAKAYERAIAAYEKSEKEEQADVLQEEMDRFLAESDMPSWRQHIPEDATEEDRLVDGGVDGDNFKVETTATPPYRVEIRAKVVEGAGGLQVSFPIEDKQWKKTSLTPEANSKEIWSILTVRSDFVSGDLGVDRPVELDEAPANNGNVLMFQAAQPGVKYRIESIRIKPLKAAVEKIEQPKPAPAAAKPAGPAAPFADFPVGKKLTGQRADNNGNPNAVTAAITMNDGKELWVKVTTLASGGVLEFRFNINGKKLNLYSVVEKKKVRKKVVRTNIGGGGMIRDGALVFDYSWRAGHARKIKNDTGKMTLK